METFWSPAVGMAAAVCLKNRSRFMNALQLLITIFNCHSGWQVCISTFMLLNMSQKIRVYSIMLILSVVIWRGGGAQNHTHHKTFEAQVFTK